MEKKKLIYWAYSIGNKINRKIKLELKIRKPKVETIDYCIEEVVKSLSGYTCRSVIFGEKVSAL